jgi:hypothetical protein
MPATQPCQGVEDQLRQPSLSLSMLSVSVIVLFGPVFLVLLGIMFFLSVVEHLPLMMSVKCRPRGVQTRICQSIH